MGCFQYFPTHSTRVGNVAAWRDRCSCMATDRQYTCVVVIHRRGNVACGQASEDLYTNVWQKTKLQGDYWERQERIGGQFCHIDTRIRTAR